MKRSILVTVIATLILLLAACTAVNAGGPQAAPAAPTAGQPAPAAPNSGSDAAAPATAAVPAASSAAGPAATQASSEAAPAGGAGPSASEPATATAAPPAAAVTATVPAATSAPAAAATATAPAAAAAASSQAPVCTPGALTPALTEGPYYKANPPQNSNLVQPGMTGTKLTITGYVLDANCKPIAGARVDFWQANAAGQYDNSGYTLRGYQVTDAQGRYTVETVVPGLYTGRTRHIHVKVTPPGGSTLTTQLYFPGEAANSRDQFFAEQNVLKIQNTANGEVATFDFVVETK